MEYTARYVVRTSSGSLVEAVAGVHEQFMQLQQDLRAARLEISSLRRSLAELEPVTVELPELDLSSLRRHVAFYCHPDRSGDGELMMRLNVLFDYLERARGNARPGH